jgi:hypothetical protein
MVAMSMVLVQISHRNVSTLHIRSDQTLPLEIVVGLLVIDIAIGILEFFSSFGRVLFCSSLLLESFCHCMQGLSAPDGPDNRSRLLTS